ncbi:MAG: hypothetical protein K2M12_07215 [Muribaculaceae bacterium]|nr:hypothetical protein [Muribaculaceae bacterium]
MNWLLYPFSKLIFSKKHPYKFYRRLVSEKAEAKEFIEQFDIDMGNSKFMDLCYGYALSASMITSAVLIKCLDIDNAVRVAICVILILLSVIFGWKLSDKIVYSHGYIEYFNMFAKEDVEWHREWRRRAEWCRVLCLVSVVLGGYILFSTWNSILE